MTPGTIISHYRIVDQLGRGGMGIVYKAEDTKLDRVVALKVLPKQALASEDDRARFYREARAAASLHHPNVATVFEIDEVVIPVDPATSSTGAGSSMRRKTVPTPDSVSYSMRPPCSSTSRLVM